MGHWGHKEWGTQRDHLLMSHIVLAELLCNHTSFVYPALLGARTLYQKHC